MPCTTYEGEQERVYRASQLLKARLYDEIEGQLHERDAMLCAVLTVFNQGKIGYIDSHDEEIVFEVADILAEVDWQAAGVDRKNFEIWWKQHQEKDGKHLRKDAKQLATTQPAALSNLDTQ